MAERKIGAITEHELEEQLQADIDAADRFFDGYVKGDILTRYQLVQGDKDYYKSKFARLSARSSYVSYDIADAVEWIMPSILELFFGGPKILSLAGRTPDDDPWALEQLIQYQLTCQNQGFMIFQQYIYDALKAGRGVIKAVWRRESQKQRRWVHLDARSFLGLPDDAYRDARELPDGTFEALVEEDVMVRNQPVLLNMMPGTWIYNPQCEEDGRFRFEAGRVYRTRDQILRMAKQAGYRNLEKALEDAGYGCEALDDILQQIMENDSDELSFRTNPTTDASRDIFLPYECIGRYDLRGKGMSDWVLATMINNVMVSAQPYPYEGSCYHGCNPYVADYQVWGRGVADLLQDLQDLKTALMRQIIVNVAINNERRIIMDANQTDAIKAYNSGKLTIPMRPGPGGRISDLFAFAPHAPLSPETFSLIENLQGAVEQRTGVTRYNQGLDANSLNKTATGISKIMNASQQRIRMIARVIAETGMKSLFRFMIELNQKHVDQEMVLRLTNEYLTIRPDDIEGKYDVEVASAVGSTDPQQQVQNMMLLMQGVYPGLMQMGLVGPQELYNSAAKIVEGLGYRNVNDFVKDPQQQQQMMAGVPGVLPGEPGGDAVTPEAVMAAMTAGQGGMVG